MMLYIPVITLKIKIVRYAKNVQISAQITDTIVECMRITMVIKQKIKFTWVILVKCVNMNLLKSDILMLDFIIISIELD